MARTPVRTWWAFGLTGALVLLLMIGAAIHVALRWEPSVIAHVEVGEWMEFETFRIRVEHAEIADSFAGFADTQTTSDTEGMRLLLVRLDVERHSEPPEDWSQDLDSVCEIDVVNSGGLLMEDNYYSAVGPTARTCLNSSTLGPDEWGDEMTFTSQMVVSVTPDPLSSFTLRVQHLRGSERDHVWTSSLA